MALVVFCGKYDTLSRGATAGRGGRDGLPHQGDEHDGIIDKILALVPDRQH